MHIREPSVVVRLAGRLPGIGALEHRYSRVQLYKSQTIELSFLAAATIYAFTIPFKGQIDLLDAVVLIGLFGLYMYFSSRAEVVEPELVGPAALIGNLQPSNRRVVVLVTFIFSAAVIFLSAEPFAEGMIETGKNIGIDEFLLIQWVAPLASEAPEIVVACIFAIRGDASSALGLLVSAKVNQWSLLVGSLPIVYSASVGSPSALPLDERQAQEVLLTAAQSLFAGRPPRDTASWTTGRNRAFRLVHSAVGVAVRSCSACLLVCLSYCRLTRRDIQRAPKDARLLPCPVALIARRTRSPTTKRRQAATTNYWRWTPRHGFSSCRGCWSGRWRAARLHTYESGGCRRREAPQ